MSTFAKGTSVSVDRSLGEIRTMLKRAGASSFVTVDDDQGDEPSGGIGFTLAGLGYRIMVEYPKASDPAISKTPTGRTRKLSPQQLEAARDAEIRRRWRSLALNVKGKLVAAADGIRTVEQEFFSDLVLDGGMTVFETARAQGIERLASSSRPMALLLGAGQ